MSFVRLFVILMATALLAGCSSSPPPQEVAAEFYRMSFQARKMGLSSIPEEMWKLLSSGSQEKILECSRKIEKEVDKPVGFTYLDCAPLLGFEGEMKEPKIETVASGQERVRLEVDNGSSKRLLELVKEGGGWKIDLPSTFDLNAQEGR